MTLLIKNGRYAFLKRLDLMFSMSLWKDYLLLQTLNDLSTRHFIKLIWFENLTSKIKIWYAFNVRMPIIEKIQKI